MRRNIPLTITSLLTIVFMTIHGTQDIQNGVAPRGMANMIGILIIVVWMYGTIILAGRRSGFIIILAANLFGVVIPVIHLKGAGIAPYHDAFFVWTVLALGITAAFSVVLAARGLWMVSSSD